MISLRKDVRNNIRKRNRRPKNETWEKKTEARMAPLLYNKDLSFKIDFVKTRNRFGINEYESSGPKTEG